MSKFTIKALTFIVALAVVAGVAGVSPAQAASLTQGQIDAILNLLTSFNADASVVDNVRASLTGGTPTGGATPPAGACNFTQSLTVGSTGNDVKCLQQYLNGAGFPVSASGAGSPGNETTYFGSRTKAAVAAWQNANASAVLAPVGLTTGTGYWGSSSIAYYNSISGGGVTPPQSGGTPPPVAVGSGLTITPATQPEASLAPYLAARVPFTRFTLTAGSSDVVVNGVTVERTGLAVDANFSGVMLIDDTGIQMGLAKTLNSNHQATVGGTFTVKAGTSRTYAIGGNIAGATTVNAGEVPSLSLVAVNTTAPVTGSLPIVGAGHTINATLAIATVAASVGTLDPNTSISKDIGTTDYTFQSVKLTNNSNTEKARLRSIRWNQTGSAAANTDLVNVESVVNDVVYPATVSSDGKYYTVRYGSGVVIDKGTSIEATIRGDIEDGSTRTVIFDINKAVDIDVTGELYGYGVTVTQSANQTAATTGTQLTSGTPFFDGATVTINSGSLTVTKSNADAAQNVVENTLGQPLGSWDVEVKGEPVSVAQMVFNIAGQSGAGGDASDVTNAVLQDANGNIIAGPADGVASGDKITFSDTVIFPVGKETYFLRGKLSTDWSNNDTIIASTTPSTQWTTVTGQTSGDSITPSPTAKVAANTMTVKAPAITMSVSSLPNAQTVVGGGNVEFANYILDTTNSGDDMKFSALKLDFEKLTGVATNLTSCTLKDGATELTTGSNRVDPTVDDDDITFTFDSAFIVPKGTVKTLSLSCETSATTTNDSYRWGLNNLTNAANSAVGVNSGTTVNTAALGMTVNSSTGQTLTVTTGGSYTVVDNNTQGYTVVSPGTESELLKLRFAALQEDVDVRRVNLQLTEAIANSASNTPLSLVGQSVTLWSGGKQIATAAFSNAGATVGYATSTEIAAGDLRIPKGSFKDVTVKGTIAGIAADVGPMTASGQLLKVDYDGDSNGLANGNYGSGVSGGTNISPASSDTSVAGVRIMKAYPTFTKYAVSDTLIADQSDFILYKFAVTANGGDVSFYKFTFNVASSSKRATTSLFSLYAYTNQSGGEFSGADTSFDSAGLLNFGQCFNGSNDTGAGAAVQSPANHPNVPTVEIYMEKDATTCNTATTTYTVPSGQTRYFELKATVANTESVSGTESFQVSLLGDAAFPVNSGTLLSKPNSSDYEPVDNDTNDDLIWSPRSTSSSASIDDLDWTNGYQVPGLPTVQMSANSFVSEN